MFGIGRMDRVPNERIRDLCRGTIKVDERIDEVVLRWLGHVERRENDRIAKGVYVGESAVVARWEGRVRDGRIPRRIV